MQTLRALSLTCFTAGALSLASCTERPSVDSQSGTLDPSTSTGVEPPQSTTTSGPTSESPTSGPPTPTGPTSGSPTTEPTSGEPTTETLPPMTTDSTTFEEPSCGFLCFPDGGTTLLECDPWVQDCPQGQKCIPWASSGDLPWDATKCAPVAANPDASGATCTVEAVEFSGADTCDVGLMCFFVDDATLEGECVALCGGNFDDPKCPDGLLCATIQEGVLEVCLPPCDPLLQDCTDGRTCTFTGGSDGFVCLDLPTGAGGPLAPCEVSTDCATGLFCGPGEQVSGACGAGGCCTPLCDANQPASCPGPDQICAPFFKPGQAPPGQEHVGVCALP